MATLSSTTVASSATLWPYLTRASACLSRPIDVQLAVPHACLTQRSTGVSTGQRQHGADGAIHQLIARLPRSQPRQPVVELPFPKLNTGLRFFSSALKALADRLPACGGPVPRGERVSHAEARSRDVPAGSPHVRAGIGRMSRRPVFSGCLIEYPSTSQGCSASVDCVRFSGAASPLPWRGP